MTGAHHRRPRSLGQRVDAWLVRAVVWGPGRPERRAVGPVPDLPGADPREGLGFRLALLGIAVILPVLVAALLVPLRDVLAAPTQTLVLVVPVVAVAALAHRAAAALAAVSAALAYDILLTEPYGSFAIDAARDAEAALVLGAIGLAVGTVVAREIEARTRASSRADELALLRSVGRALATGGGDRLVAAATEGIRDLLDLRSCAWAEGFHGRVGHVLAGDGSLGGWQGAGLPEGTVEVPVVHRGVELGRLVLRAGSPRPVSVEERGTVLAVADLLALGLAAEVR